MGLIRLNNQSPTDVTTLPAATVSANQKQFVWAFPAAATVSSSDLKYQSGGATSTDGSHLNLRCPADMTVKAMYLRINGTPSSGSTVVTLMKNSSTATGTSITTNTTTGDYSTTTETSFSAGDTIGIRITCSNTTPHWNHVTLLCELD